VIIRLVGLTRQDQGFKSILLTSSLFGLFHLHFGFAAVVLTMVSSFRRPDFEKSTLIPF